MSSSRLLTCTPMLAVLVALSLVGCVSARSNSASLTASRSQLTSSLAEPTGSFLTVTNTFDTTRPDGPAKYWLIKYGVATLQVRSARGGRVIATLLHSLGIIYAVRAADGTVIAVEDLGCRSPVLRINPLTGHTTLIRTLPGLAQQPALSPDGRELAYLTYARDQPQPCAPSRQPAHSIQEQVFNTGPGPVLNVLAIVNLSSGATVSASTGITYNSLDRPTWSPDGTRVAVTYGQHSIEEVSAARPEFALPPPIKAAKGCFFDGAAWTTAGLVVVSGCGGETTGSAPQKLLQLTPTGQQTRSWQLPRCIDGTQLYGGLAGRHVLVETDIGYGNSPPCGDPNHPGEGTIRVAEIRGNQLDLITSYPQPPNAELYVAGW